MFESAMDALTHHDLTSFSPLSPSIIVCLSALIILSIHVLHFLLTKRTLSQMSVSLRDQAGHSLNRFCEQYFDAAGDHVPRPAIHRVGPREADFPAITTRPRPYGPPLAPVTGFLALELTPDSIEYMGGSVISDREVAHSLVCSAELLVEGQCSFHGAVKVRSDLCVRGEAVFTNNVVVDGRLLIEGKAAFSGGLLCKSELIVDGELFLVMTDDQSWIKTADLAGSGKVWLIASDDELGSCVTIAGEDRNV